MGPELASPGQEKPAREAASNGPPAADKRMAAAESPAPSNLQRLFNDPLVYRVALLEETVRDLLLVDIVLIVFIAILAVKALR